MSMFMVSKFPKWNELSASPPLCWLSFTLSTIITAEGKALQSGFQAIRSIWLCSVGYGERQWSETTEERIMCPQKPHEGHGFYAAGLCILGTCIGTWSAGAPCLGSSLCTVIVGPMQWLLRLLVSSAGCYSQSLEAVLTLTTLHYPELLRNAASGAPDQTCWGRICKIPSGSTYTWHWRAH